jgi:hypothetical protein
MVEHELTRRLRNLGVLDGVTDIGVTLHAEKRARKRLGLRRGAVKRAAMLALTRGEPTLCGGADEHPPSAVGFTHGAGLWIIAKEPNMTRPTVVTVLRVGMEYHNEGL